MAYYRMYLFTNWMIQNHEEVLKLFLKKDGFQAKIIVDLMFLHKLTE